MAEASKCLTCEAKYFAVPVEGGLKLICTYCNTEITVPLEEE